MTLGKPGRHEQQLTVVDHRRDELLGWAVDVPNTSARAGIVNRAVGGAQEPVPGNVPKAVGLVVHFHGHVGTPVEVGIDLALVADRKPSASLPGVIHIKGHGQATVLQVIASAQGHGFSHVESP